MRCARPGHLRRAGPGPAAAGLLPGLVVGDTRSMDPVLDEDFQRAGLALTAVSGPNVAIVLTAVLWPLRGGPSTAARRRSPRCSS